MFVMVVMLFHPYELKKNAVLNAKDVHYIFIFRVLLKMMQLIG